MRRWNHLRARRLRALRTSHSCAAVPLRRRRHGVYAVLLGPAGQSRLSGFCALLLALLEPGRSFENHRAVLLAVRESPHRPGGHRCPALLTNVRTGSAVLGDLAAVLSIDEVRMGGAAAVLIQDRSA